MDTSGAGPSDDIRLLGRLLGDAIRSTEGDETFELVEQIRRLAVDGRRSGTSSVDAMREILGRQPLAEQLLVVRALDWLSLLANAAEDSYVERMERAPTRRSVLGASRQLPGGIRAHHRGGGGRRSAPRRRPAPPDQPGHHRAPHRGAPQDHPRGARRHRPAARRSVTASAATRWRAPRSRRSSHCGSCCCGRPRCSGSRSCGCATRSTRRSGTTARVCSRQFLR